MHRLELLVSQMDLEGTHDSISADHSRHGERDVFDSIFAVHNSGCRKDCVLIVENALDETACSHRDASVGETFLVDNIVGDLDKFLLDRFFIETLGVMEILIEIVDWEASATGGAPCDECRVSMLAENIAVDVFRIDFIFVREDTTEAISLEESTSSEDQIARIIELRRDDVRRNIERIGDEDDDSFLRAFLNFAEDGIHDLCVCASEFQAIWSLARANGRSSADDDDVRAFAIIIIAFMDFDVGGVDTCGSVAGIDRFAFRFIDVKIDEDDLACELEVRDFVDDCRADIGSSDDDDLSAIVSH